MHFGWGEGAEIVRTKWLPVPSVLGSRVPYREIRLSRAAPSLVLRGILSHHSETAERFLEGLVYAAMPVGVSGSIERHDWKPEIAAERPSFAGPWKQRVT